MFNDKRYLLLSDEMTEDFQVAYEEKNELIYLNKKDEIYNKVLSMLCDKLTKEINEIWHYSKNVVEYAANKEE